MAVKLYFIKNEDGPIAVFEDRRSAKDELENFRIDDEMTEFRLYSIPFDDLEEYEAELELAEHDGLV